jgi:glycosyltransferase involved in cell wall biosynthesis
MGQIVHVIREGENGLLVPAGDVQGLANAINRLIDEPNLREKLGKQAREDAVQNHSWEQYLSYMQQILADVTTGNHQ